MLAVAPVPALATGSAAYAAGAGWTADLSDGRVALRSFGTAPDGRSVLRLQVRVCSYDLALTALADDDGAFEITTDNAAPGSTDETDGSITIDGELRGGDVVGEVQADVRTYDNAGDTGSCELDEEYTAEPRRRARGYDRVSVVALLEPDELTANDDAAYATVDTRQIARIDETGDETWSVETTDQVVALAASTDAVWAVQPGAVDRLEPATGETTATLPLEGADEAVAADDGSLWVEVNDESVVHVAADGQSSLSVTELGGRAFSLAASGDGLIVSVQNTDSYDQRLVRIDASGQIAAQVPVDDATEIAVVGDVLWVRGLAAPVIAHRLDTLEPAEQSRQIRRVDAMASVGDVLWVAARDDLLGYSPDGQRVARIAGAVSGGDFSLLVGTPTALWVESASTLLRVV